MVILAALDDLDGYNSTVRISTDMIKRYTLTVLITCISLLCSRAQNFNKNRMDSLMTILQEGDRFMGSVAVATDGKIIYTAAVGFDDLEAQDNSTTKTKYRIGSITKMFTSALILKAVEEGKLDLDQTIEVYFPSIQNSGKITVAMLLKHRSGIFNFTNASNYEEWNTESKTEEEIIQLISESENVFEPNDKAEYSNSNYVLLTFILQRVYKDSYSKILDRKILRPLGLKNTYVGSTIDVSNDESYSYKFSKEWIRENETDMSIPLGAGNIVSTPTDLTIFAEALFSDKIISKSSLEKMTTMQDGFGLGIFQFPYYNKELYGHTGGIDGFSSFLVYLPANRLSVAITSNGSNYSNNDFLIGVLSCYYNKPYTLPVFGAIELKSTDLTKYLGTYSSTQFPLKITISTDADSTALVARATGQSAFQLEATAVDRFSFNPAGIVLEFEPSENKMTLKQAGLSFLYTKD